MQYLILLIGLILGVSTYILILNHKKQKIKMKQLIVSFSIFIIVTLILLVELSHYAHLTLLTEIIFGLITCSFGVLLIDKIVYKRKNGFFAYALICQIVLFGELFIYNYGSFETGLTKNKQISYSTVDLTADNTVDLYGISFDESGMKIKKGSVITISSINQNVNNIQLKMRGDSLLSELRVVFLDESSSNSYQYASTDDNNNIIYNTNVPSSLLIDINGKGNVDEIVIEFANNIGTQYLDEINLNVYAPLNISIVRMLLIIGLVILFYLIIKKQWYKYQMNLSKGTLFNIITLSCLGVAFIILFFAGLLMDEQLMICYPLDNIYDYSDANFSSLLQFDAFMKGQLHLDISPSHELLALENPYDPSTRGATVYLWDRAFYNGKYYSYFGLTPIFLFYYPVYLLTACNYVPTNLYIQMAYLFIGIFASLWFIKELAITMKKQITILNYVLFNLIIIGLGGFLLACIYPRIYTTPVAGGIVMMLLYLVFALKYYNASKKYLKHIYLGLTALFFILMVMARPNMALTFVLVVPLFINRIILIFKQKEYKELYPFISFATILLIGLTGILTYNYVRFDSLFEFGSSYQLTVSDIRYNNITIDKIPLSIYHFFFQPLDHHYAFPYFDTSFSYIGGYEGYTYIVNSFGLLMIPIFLVILCIPYIIKRQSLTYKATGIVALVLIFVFSWISYSLAGVIERYILDIMGIGSVMVIFVLMDLSNRINPKSFFKVFTPLILVSLFIGLNLAFAEGMSDLRFNYPELLLRLRDLMQIF